jgi:hypothetical protein
MMTKGKMLQKKGHSRHTMSPTRQPQTERPKTEDTRAEVRSSRSAAHAPHSRDRLSAPLPDLDGHGFSRGTPASRKAVRLSLMILSAMAVCAFGFGLLAELVG